MLLTLPEKFDENEWFLIICILITYTILFFLPKRFPTSISVLLFLWGPVIARVCDHFFASPELDLYNLMDTPAFDLFDFITYFLYAPFSYFFIYLYDKWRIKGYWILLYLFTFTTAGTFFEWINTEFHVFTYKKWHLSYSFSFYLATQCLTLLFFCFIRKRYHAAPSQKTSTLR